MEQPNQKVKENNLNKVNLENDKIQDNINKQDFKQEKTQIGSKVRKINYNFNLF